MKRILFALSVLLVMFLSGCNSHKAEPMEPADTASSIQEMETSVPTQMPAETSEPTEVPTEASESTEAPTETSEPTQAPTETSEPTQMPAEDADDRKKGLCLGVSAADPEHAEPLHILPSTFIFAESTSWTTEITLEADGTFTGESCYLENIDEIEYPFHGKFRTPQKVSEYIYSMQLESLAFDESVELVYEEHDYVNNITVQKTLTVPKGFENAREFLIYLPGCPLEDLPAEYLPKCSINTRIRQTIPSGVYRLYNAGGKAGFRAEEEDSFWSQGYRASNASLEPNYCLKSALYISQENKYAAGLELAFDWNYDTQTQFVATDRDGTGTYNVFFDYSDDYQALTVTAKNTSVVNLELWGGTADGTITAEFPLNGSLPFDLSVVEEENTGVFSLLPSEFRAATAGAGAWGSTITIQEDGTFTGYYSDSDMGIQGDGYSHGLVTLSNYSGKFTEPQKISDYVYSMEIESLEYEETPGTRYFEDGFLYSITNDLDDTSEFRIYLPGCPLEDISFPEFALVDTSKGYIVHCCTGVSMNTHKTIPPGVYVICNLSAIETFKAEVEDELLWKKTYTYDYGSYSSEIQPDSSYFSNLDESQLIFRSATGGAILDFEFSLDYDSQEAFVVTDNKGTGDYNLSLAFSEDFNSVIVTLNSLSGFNLEPWGGTADGTLTAQYQVS